MSSNNQDVDLEKITAQVSSRSTIEHRSRFVPDPSGEHSYQGELYDWEGIELGIKVVSTIGTKYNGIIRLLFGLGLPISRYDDVPRDELVEKYKQASMRLQELGSTVNVGDTLEITFSKEKFRRNRAEGFCDPCLWRTDCLLYAPFGYESIDYGDGRRTAEPEVKDVKVVSKGVVS